MEQNRCKTADGTVDANAYYVKVRLPGRRRPPFTIRSIELRDMGIDMLLGMNIIRLGLLLITETRYMFTLEETDQLRQRLPLGVI